VGFRLGKSGAGRKKVKRQVFDAENYSLVWSQTTAKDMRPQRVAIRSRLSIKILLFVAETRQKGFGSNASLFQLVCRNDWSAAYAGLITVMMTILPASSRALSVVAITLPPNSVSASANASFTSRSVSR